MCLSVESALLRPKGPREKVIVPKWKTGWSNLTKGEWVWGSPIINVYSV